MTPAPFDDLPGMVAKALGANKAKRGRPWHLCRARRGAGRALLTTTLILVASFWMRLFSDLKVIADFGLVLGIALLVAFLADVLLAPALLRLFYRNREMRPLPQGAQKT